MSDTIYPSTQAKVTALLRAARDAGFESVTLDMTPDGAIRASFQVVRPTQAPPTVPEQNVLPAEDHRWLTEEEVGVAKLWSGLKLRERHAMDHLYEHRGEHVPYEGIKGASNNTQDALMARGWIEDTGNDCGPWILLPEGERVVRIARSLPPNFILVK